MHKVKTRVAPAPDPSRTAPGIKNAPCLQILVPCAAAVLLLVPFLGRAFSMDDPLFLWIAERILSHPLDPYGFNTNWSGYEMPMFRLMQNPPLNSYFIALVAHLAGSTEPILHAAFLLPAIGAAAGTFLIARRFCARPVEATLAAVLTPVFLVCGSAVMCDMMMLAFWVWAVYLWVKGMDDRRPGLLALSCALIAVTALTKYYGMALVPLLIAYSLLARRRPGWWLLNFLIPILALAGYQYWTKSLYGKGLLLDALGVAGSLRSGEGMSVGWKSAIGLAFAGGCIGSAVFHAPLLWSRRALAGGIVCAALLTVLFGSIEIVGSYALTMDGLARWLLTGHMGVFVVAGASLLLLAASDLWARRDADSALLALWLVGSLVFAGMCNWTVNGRALLPMAPVAGILMMRRIERRYSGAAPSFLLPFVLSGLLSFAVAHADYQFANSQRAAAAIIYSDYKGDGTVWFQGHWGFQYYMEHLGAKHIEYDNIRLEEGDLVVIPVNNTCVTPISQDSGGMIMEFPGSKWLSTMSNHLGTGFHSDAWGPIPYGFGLTVPEYYGIMPVDDAVVDALGQMQQ